MKLGESSRFSASEKAEVLALVARTRHRTGWTLRRILKRLGLPRARYHDWKKRGAWGRLEDARSVGLSYAAILPEEKEAVIAYALSHPKDGYRRLCWQMVDEDVAYVSPSSVYRILDDEDLLYRWKRSTRSGERPPKPTRPNERWHTDIMYLRVEEGWYFLVTVLDAYSRYVVHWELLSSMTAADVRLVVQEALERSGAKPQLVSDNGCQFTAKDFKQMVRLFELEHIRIRTYHPESNGLLERFHRSTREELAEEELENLGRARQIIGRGLCPDRRRWTMNATPRSRRDRIRAQLADLKMPGALEALEDVLAGVDGGQVTPSEAIEQLLGAQIALRNNRRLQAAMRSSRLPAVKKLEDFDFTFQPTLKREQIDSLHELGFLERKENVIFFGPPGVGKSHLAISLAVAAAQSGRRVYFGTLADLIASLEEAKAAGRLAHRLKTLTHPALLVVDEIGYLPIGQAGAILFFQLINRRYEHASTVLTSTTIKKDRVKGAHLSVGEEDDPPLRGLTFRDRVCSSRPAPVVSRVDACGGVQTPFGAHP